jgi:hypothetical protein
MMPAGIITTLKKLDSVSETNRGLMKEFVEHMRSKDHKSDRNLVNLLDLMISFDKFYDGLPFTSINSKEQIIAFLNHRYVDGRWIEREHDEEGKYIETWNRYRGLLITFFRWLTNRSRPDDEWKTPAFLEIKAKKPLRESPYAYTDYRSRRREEFNQEIVDEMKRTGKDLKTVLSERLDIDTMMSDIKNNKELPRIHRELITEELIAMKNNKS